MTAANMNLQVRDNELVLSTHTHTGAAGMGSSSLGPLVLADYTDAAAPGAPGAGKTRLYTVAGLPRYRAGAAGADTGLADLTTAQTLDAKTFTGVPSLTLAATGAIKAPTAATYIRFMGGQDVAGSGTLINLYGVGSGELGALTIYSPDAAGTGDVLRLKITGKLATAVMTLSAMTVSGLDLGASGIVAAGNLQGVTQINFDTSGRLIQGENADNAFFALYVRDNGVGLVEVARAQGAADPYVAMGGAQQFKVFNSGVASGLVLTDNVKFRSGTAFDGEFDHAISAARVWTLPDKAGTVAMLADIGWTRVGGTQTEVTTTLDTLNTVLQTISGLSILVGTPVKVVFNVRKGFAAAASFQFGLKLNTIQVMDNLTISQNDSNAGSGIVIIEFIIRDVYLRGGQITATWASTAGILTTHSGFNANIPVATITDIVLQGWLSAAGGGNVVGIQDVQVYVGAVS